MPGPIAQRRYAPRSFRNYHAGGDYRKAVDIALHLNGDGPAATAFLRWLEMCTKGFVERRWRSIEAVANALLAKPTLNSAEIRAAANLDPLTLAGSKQKARP